MSDKPERMGPAKTWFLAFGAPAGVFVTNAIIHAIRKPRNR
ncbi:MAG: hypothetical protein ABIH46_13050 [Chloroflexota bacterium]